MGVDPKAVTTYNENALFGPAYRGWNRMIEPSALISLRHIRGLDVVNTKIQPKKGAPVISNDVEPAPALTN